MIVVTLVVGGSYVASSGLMQPILDAEFQRGAAAMLRTNPQLTPEMMETGRGIAAIGAKVGAFFSMPIAVVATGLLLWLLAKLVDASMSVRSALVVSAYAFVPRIIAAVLMSVQLQFMDPAKLDGFYRLSIGPARFMDPATAPPMLLAALGRLDVFIVWTTLLLAIGLAVQAKVSLSKALVPAVIVWVCGTLPALWGAISAA